MLACKSLSAKRKIFCFFEIIGQVPTIITRTTSFFPLRKLKGNQPFPKKPAIQLLQLEEVDTDNGEDQESDDPDGIEGVMEEFMFWLARVVKDAQMDEKHCYHCSSPEHIICNCPLLKTARDKKQLNRKEGMAMTKAAWTPPTKTSTIKSPQKEAQEVWNHPHRLPSWIWTLFSDGMG